GAGVGWGAARGARAGGGVGLGRRRRRPAVRSLGTRNPRGVLIGENRARPGRPRRLALAMLRSALGRRAMMTQTLPVWAVVLAVVALLAAYGVLQWAVRTTAPQRRVQGPIRIELIRGRTVPTRPVVPGSRRTA